MKSPNLRKKLIWSLAAVGGLTVALYGFACIYVWVNQSRFIFMPQRKITQTPAEIDLVFEDVYLPVAAANGGTAGGRRRNCLLECWSAA